LAREADGSIPIGGCWPSLSKRGATGMGGSIRRGSGPASRATSGRRNFRTRGLGNKGLETSQITDEVSRVSNTSEGAPLAPRRCHGTPEGLRAPPFLEVWQSIVAVANTWHSTCSTLGRHRFVRHLSGRPVPRATRGRRPRGSSSSPGRNGGRKGGSMLARRPRSRWREGGRMFERHGMVIREVQRCERCRTYRPMNQAECGCCTPLLPGERRKPGQQPDGAQGSNPTRPEALRVA
jgi:hypothetical protein